MGSIARFKWQRNNPLGNASGTPDFYRFNLHRMRQLASLVGNASAGSGTTAVLTAYVPASSWLATKRVFMRGMLQMVLPAVGAPPTYNVTESITVGASGAIALPTPPAFVPGPGTFSTMRQCTVVRIANDLYAWDDGDAFKFNFFNLTDNIQHAHLITPPVGGWNFSTQITITLSVNMPATYAAATISALWCEAFIEQGTNLGTLA